MCLIFSDIFCSWNELPNRKKNICYATCSTSAASKWENCQKYDITFHNNNIQCGMLVVLQFHPDLIRAAWAPVQKTYTMSSCKREMCLSKPASMSHFATMTKNCYSGVAWFALCFLVILHIFFPLNCKKTSTSTSKKQKAGRKRGIAANVRQSVFPPSINWETWALFGPGKPWKEPEQASLGTKYSISWFSRWLS